MQPALPIIYCPNLKCRTPNREGDPLCQRCGASLPQRYLWVVGTSSRDFPDGSVLLDRYLFRGPQVVIDTQPGIPLASSFDVTDDVLPYLKLFPFRLHLPQVYSILSIESAKGSFPVVLLEGVPLAVSDFSETQLAAHPSLKQSFTAELFHQAWQRASALRQVNWLWQMVQLWTPFKHESVTRSLLNPDLLRVEGSLLRLLSLEADGDKIPTLADLGLFWEKWCLPYTNSWRPRFSELCDRLIKGQIETFDLLLDEMEAWLAAVRATSHVQVGIATRTDSGPTREHNEDACYPSHGTVIQNTKEGLAIVCDGVGGHAGGEVASSIAITVITDHVQKSGLTHLTSDGAMRELETAIGFANDLISQQNDREDRHDRDRMGTTVVMGLAREHDLYIANLGDSRAYLITEHGCYQLTTDDDIATREVRLGYLPHREAMRQPGAGSLIQALGMVPSSMLRPATQRFLIDSDCLLLLCSDGLSDFERVDTLWRKDLLPLLSGKIDLAAAAKQLIDQANRLNGHDNATISLLHLQLKDGPPDKTTVANPAQSLPTTQILKTVALPSASTKPPKSSSESLGSKSSDSKSSGSKSMGFMPWLLGGLVLFGSIGVLLGMFFQHQKVSESPEATPSFAPVPTPAPSQTPLTVDDSTYWKIKRSPNADPTPPTAPAPIKDLVLKSSVLATAESLGQAQEGTILKILNTSTTKERVRWLQVKICQIPPDIATNPPAETSQPSPATSPLLDSTKQLSELKLGQTGYIQAMFLEGVVEPLKANSPLAAASLKTCGITTPGSTP